MDETAAYLKEKYLEFYKKPAGYRYAICLQTNNIPIGFVHLEVGDSFDLGYAIMKTHWHQGIATEACEALLGELRKTDIAYITATHDVNNPQSGKIMEKLGMKYCYSYDECWQPKNFLVTFRMYQLNFDGEDNRVYQKYGGENAVHFVEENL